MNHRIKKLTTAVLATALLASNSTVAQKGATNGEWHANGGGKGAAKYAPLTQITPENFKDLKIAWTWDSIDNTLETADPRIRKHTFQPTPIMANGVLYLNTSLSQVAAIDAGTGKTLWTYDPGSWREGRPANMGFIQRGVTYWADGDDERVIVPTGHNRLIALNAKKGKPIPSFGDNGEINLREGLNRVPRLAESQVNSPPMIVNDVIVTGCVVFDRPSTKSFVRGDIRGFDVRTGKKLWTFHSIPQEGEFGNETWTDDAWKVAGNTNVWSIISGDEDLGYVYLPFGAPTNDFYGGHRPGDNLYGNSVVCLNARTGERVWHFQTVHHDLWDYDLPAAPNLIDIVVDGKPIKALAQVGKTGFVYTFDRETGEPVWPIEERPVPISTTPGEKASPTQPFPTKPAPFGTIGLTEDNIVDFTPEIKAEALEFIKQYGFAPIFSPATEKGTFSLPFNGGAGNWRGAAWDPETNMLYVMAMNMVDLLQISKPDPARSNMDYLLPGLPTQPRLPSGIPLIKPPYASITAINMNSGEHTWQTPVGDGIENHPKLKHLNLPPTGGGGWANPVITKTMLIAGKSGTMIGLDKATGEIIDTLRIDQMGVQGLGYVSGMPITYMQNGKQYITFAMTNGERNGTLVGMTLP